MIHVNVMASSDVMMAKARLDRGPSKNMRSIQYSKSHTSRAMGVALYTHLLIVNMLQRSTIPAAAQPAPVMDRYNGLSRASFS